MNSDEMYEAARKRMFDRTKRGEAEKKTILETVSKMVIVDRLVPPKLMTFFPPDTNDLGLRYGATGTDAVKIHRHALNQLCAKVNFPMTYLNALNKRERQLTLDGEATDWKRKLLCHNLNELFHRPEWMDRGGTPTRFLHRIVDGELRGFLSRRYNRHLASAPLLQAFISACELKDAIPIEATASSVRVALKYLLPDVFEAFPGEYIGIGSEWANSDFGAGRMTVTQMVWRISTGTSAVLDETLGRVHLGSIIEDSDLEMSEETAKAETEALKSGITDAVNHQFSVNNVDRLLTALRAARDEQIPWGKLKGQLARFLSKADVDWLQNILDGKGESIVDLPPVSFAPDGTRTPNLYWTSGAVGAIASRTEDPDEKLRLQKEAGKILAALLEE